MEWEDNWYSEIQIEELITFKNYKDFLNYLTIEWKNKTSYKECYVPGFWLSVPETWTID